MKDAVELHYGKVGIQRDAFQGLQGKKPFLI